MSGLSAMGNNGFQEPATGFEDGKIVGTKRLYTDGKFGTKDGKATFMEALLARTAGAGQGRAEGQQQVSDQQRPQRTLSGRTPSSTRTANS